MIRSTKAVMQDVSEKINLDLFEILLQDINIQNYTQKASELFVTFECIEEDQESYIELEDGVIYLTVQIPYQKMLNTECPFNFQIDCFLDSLSILEEIVDSRKLSEDCRVVLITSKQTQD